MPGFDRKELRGKLALAITANFKNYYSREEAAVEEISGVAFIFNQKFFKVCLPHKVEFYSLHMHAQRGLQYLNGFCVCVCVLPCLIHLQVKHSALMH